MIRALAVRALRLYPGTWRMRYEEEVRALLEDAPPGAGQLLELLRGAATEWIHAFADPASRPRAPTAPPPTSAPPASAASHLAAPSAWTPTRSEP